MNPRRQRGFTLLEVLLATTLLAAGMALAFATLRTAAATTERGEAITERNERVRAVSSFLQRRIGGAHGMAFEVDPAIGASKRFEGDSRTMRFIADLPDYLSRGGPHLHVLEASGDGLRVAFQMVQAGEALPAARPPEALASGLRRVAFAYRGLTPEGEPGDWQPRWDTPEALPLQVRVRIEDARGRWPDVVVALPMAPQFSAAALP